MPHKDGLETLRDLRQIDSTLPVIMLSGAPSPWTIVDAMKSGASDFLAKPVSHEDLGEAIRKTLRHAPLDAVCASPPAHHDGWSGTWMNSLEPLLNRVGPSDVPVLLEGETGVGKEVVARQIHLRSNRAAKPFLKLNCAALPAELVESELFGYERGAFTGAFKNYPGKFEMAEGGTILLDEIGDMDFKLQAKLLQVLQDHEFLRLGAREPSHVDVRVMAATHCNLRDSMRTGRFREDLYYRLNVVRIVVPPLRERRGDILPLAHAFIKRHSSEKYPPLELPSYLNEHFLRHDWPGNIRELENVMRRLLVLRRPEMVAEELLSAAHPVHWAHGLDDKSKPASFLLPPVFSKADDMKMRVPIPPPGSRDTSQKLPVQRAQKPKSESILHQFDAAQREAEREAIMAALQKTYWNRKRAAILLNIDYKGLLYKMKKLGIGEQS
jgi:two-component system response regulator AtoC